MRRVNGLDLITGNPLLTLSLKVTQTNQVAKKIENLQKKNTIILTNSYKKLRMIWKRYRTSMNGWLETTTRCSMEEKTITCLEQTCKK